MPDQYDPRVSPRSTTGHRPADPRRGKAEAEDDPLAELAKMVHGRPSPSAAPADKGAARAPGSGGLADLEAELLNDLQASFAAVRESQPQRPPASRPRVVEPEPIFTSPFTSQFTAPRPPEPAPAPRQEAPPPPPLVETRPDPQLRDEFRPVPFDDSQFVPIPPPPVVEPIIRQTVPEQRFAERPIERRSERPVEPPYEEPEERLPRVLRPDGANESRPDMGNFQMRPTAPVASFPPAPPPVQASTRQPHSRWEKPEPQRPQPATSSSRFAPPRVAALPAVDEDAELDPFAEGGLFADAAEPEEEFPLDGLGMVPGYGEDENLPPYPDDDLESLVRRRRPTRNLIIVGAVVAIALVGGISFAMFSSGTTGTTPPPLIAADGGPTKITPDDSATTDTDAQNKLIYDRVNSGEAANSDTTLVTPGDGPINDVATDDTSNNAISRVIIPGGPGIDAPATDDALRLDNQQDSVAPPVAETPSDAITALAANDAAGTNDPDAIQPIGPRKVRTVVVKPDGTILSSNATDAAAPADAAAPQATAVTPLPTPTPPVTDDTAAIAGNAGKDLPITDAPDTTATAEVAQPEPPPVAEPAPTAVAEAKPLPKPTAETKVALAEPADANAPIDLAKNGPATAGANGGTLVQISSQKSEDAARATYRELQRRYPNILGRYEVNIQRADVPDRGTFYRVRVGPFSGGDAQRLCDDLKSAGGDCVLAKR